MDSIQPTQAKSPEWTVVDVRSTSGRAAVCVPGSLHRPLETIDRDLAQLPKGGIALLCKSGTRARLAQRRLARRGIQAAVIDGGMDAWLREDLPVSHSTHSTWSLERQVRFGAGLLVLAGTILAVLVSPRWLLLTGFVGCGLIVAGATDICLMGNALARTPWNRIRSGT